MDPFITDRADGLVIYAGRLYWSTNCGDDFSPPQSRVKSWAIGDFTAPIAILYMPSTCQGDRVASSSVAIDDAAVYWLTGDGHVVRLPLDAPMTTPAVLCATRTLNIGGWPSMFCIVTNGRNVYWSEGAELYTVPITGGAAAVLANVVGASSIRSLRLGSDGLLYVLADTTLHRIPTAGAAILELVADNVVAFGLSRSRLAWIASDPTNPTVSVLSAPFASLTRTTTHYTSDGTVDARRRTVIESVAMDDRSVYWHELKNLTGGPIFRCGLTHRSTPVAISDYQLGDTFIVTDGSYVFWTDYNSGLFRIEVGAPSVPAPGHVWITGTEPVQSIQTIDSRVPLIAYKRTFVRVYCRSQEDARGAWSGVTARLTVEGFSRWHSPINQYMITVSPSGSDRSMLTDSFLFELDPEETHPGTRSIRVQLFPPAGRPQSEVTNHSATRMLVFGPAGSGLSLSVYGARYRYRNVPMDVQSAQGLSSSIWPEWPLSAYELHRAVAEQPLPIASLRIEPGPVVAEVDYSTPDGRVGAGYETARAWAVNQIDTAHPEGGRWLLLIQPEIEGAGSHHGADIPTGRGNHVINFQHNTEEPGITLIHELSHSFGICHPLSVSPAYGCNDSSFPRANNSMGPEVALSVAPPGVGGSMAETLSMISGQRADGSILRYEIMSYNQPSWISLYTYNKGMRGASGGRWVAPSTVEGGG